MSLRPNTRTEVRKKSYKVGVDADDARRRREDNLIEIRKNKREDSLLKKRREGLLFQSQQQFLGGAPVDNAALIRERSIAATLFAATPTVPDNVLTEAFQVGTKEVEKIKTRLAPKK